MDFVVLLLLFWKLCCQPNQATISQLHLTNMSAQLGSNAFPSSLCNELKHPLLLEARPSWRDGSPRHRLLLPTTAVLYCQVALDHFYVFWSILHGLLPLHLPGGPSTSCTLHALPSIWQEPQNPSPWPHQPLEDQLRLKSAKWVSQPHYYWLRGSRTILCCGACPVLCGRFEPTKVQPWPEPTKCQKPLIPLLRCNNQHVSRHGPWSRTTAHSEKGTTFPLLTGTASRHQVPRSNKWWSQQVSPCQSADQHLRRLNAAPPLPPAPSQPGAKGRWQPPEPGAYLHILWEHVLEARRSKREDLLCDYLSRVRVTFSAP